MNYFLSYSVIFNNINITKIYIELYIKYINEDFCNLL